MRGRSRSVILLAVILVSPAGAAGRVAGPHHHARGRAGPPQRPQDVESYRMARSLALRGKLDRALKLLADEIARGFDATRALADPAWRRARDDPRFKDLMRDGVIAAESWIAPTDEPGAPLLWHLQIVDAEDDPVTGALVYAEQTSTGDGPPITVLYAYARSDGAGWVHLHTVRPQPTSASPPTSIYVRVRAPDARPFATQALIAGDPRLDASTRAAALENGWLILEPRMQGHQFAATSKLTLPDPTA